MSEAKISIIVPIYNVETELSRCVESILVQSYGCLEVILVDDGSTDGCPDKCDAFEKMDARIRVIHKSNGGLSSARNAGLRLATGDWVLYVDSDDYIVPDACERLLSIGEKCACDIVVGDAMREFGDGRELMAHASLNDGGCYPPNELIEKAVKACEWHAPACFNMYRRDFLIENDLYFVEGLLHEDMEMQPRVFLAAESIAYCAYPFYRYVDRPSSIMNASKINDRVEAMEGIYAEWKARFEKIEDLELRRVLNGHLAKCYLRSCCEFGRRIDVAGVTPSFIIANSLNAKELVKAITFAVAPSKYLNLGGGR